MAMLQAEHDQAASEPTHGPKVEDKAEAWKSMSAYLNRGISTGPQPK